ncbi:hypothetical protein A3B87_00180 [Candidatus Kuenenbacteria bacterium RIFCSPHIGHO2_02_FULL_39_13]|uniref:PseI/NeuA/B-like domain-containing protein n=1 Tax=Candidatus Kuenenbacteria bacterium RIFCSPHIGHO2_02_FULL_39_13 TaxID=1798561 RepID=A0A1F6FN48_9BACT|nr:MAG: hypothetical protein A3B87_00180 [Candidatus Kuenenbacteria bacterium RIFCSPHIGHO2_02_FULL_39_13]
MAKIIAELCQNHLGNRQVLGDAIRAAATAGADYVKAQIIFSADLIYRPRFENGQIENNGVIKTIKRPYQPEFERLQKLDLKPDDYKYFIEEAVKNNVTPIASVLARRRIELVAKLPWPERTIKVASYDCGSYPMLHELCDAFDHLIISTGASYDEEIEEAARIVKSHGKKLTFMHCVTSYPNALEMCHLSRLHYLRQFTDSVGWSDHTLIERDELKAAQVALYLGANIVERHFTVLKKDETKDGPISINPDLLKELVAFKNLTLVEQKEIIEREIPQWQIMLGQEKRELTHTEILNRDYYRGRFASLVWRQNWEE